GRSRWRSEWLDLSFQPRRKAAITSQTQRGRSEKRSPAITEASSTTQTPSPGEACEPGSRRSALCAVALLPMSRRSSIPNPPTLGWYCPAVAAVTGARYQRREPPGCLTRKPLLERIASLHPGPL